MKKILRTARVWVSVALIGILFFLEYAKQRPPLANFIENNIANPYRRLAGRVFGIVPFSVTETIYIIAGAIVIFFVAQTIYLIIKCKGKRVHILANRALTALTTVLIVLNGTTILWGVGYYCESPVSRMEVSAQPISVEQLATVTELFVDKLSKTAELVERDENEIFNEPIDELLEEGYTVYDNLEGVYPFLEGEDITAKPMAFSFFMSELNYTGFFFALTGEPNVNIDTPGALIPSTIAHELAHARGIMPEQDCNFVAILACEYSDNSAYQYSGQLLAFINLSNALYGADREVWEETVKNLHPYVIADLQYNSEYWAQFKGPVSEVADTIYNGYLEGHGQEEGIKSYGMVTDLLVDWYYDDITATAS